VSVPHLKPAPPLIPLDRHAVAPVPLGLPPGQDAPRDPLAQLSVAARPHGEPISALPSNQAPQDSGRPHPTAQRRIRQDPVERGFEHDVTAAHAGRERLEAVHAVIGNCGTLLSFRVGMEDAELLAPAFSKHPRQLTRADLCNLPTYTAYARLLIDGHPSRPFSLRTLPLHATSFDEQRAEIVRRTSRHRYAKAVAESPVEAKDRATPLVVARCWS
jgi:hypothetical protein